MADNTLALQVNANPIDLKSTIGTLSQLQLANAHAGLYGLQAEQEKRKLNALQYLKDNPTDYLGYIQQGGDPSVGSTLQGMGEKERQYGTNPQKLSTESALQLTGAGKNLQETNNLKIEADKKRNEIQLQHNELRGNAAKSILTDPSDDNWNARVDELIQGGHVSPQGRAQILNAKTPDQRKAVAQAMLAATVPSTETLKLDPNAIARRAAATQIGTQSGELGQMPPPAAPPATFVQRFGSAFPPTSAAVVESKAYGGELAKVLPALSEKADASRQANFTLDQMKAESQSWRMGKGGTALMQAQQYLKPIANSLGSDMFDKPVADFESFQKNAGTLTRQAVKEVSSRAAVQEFSMIQKQLPSADMSRKGFDQIANQFQSINDYNIAKHQAGQTWRDNHGTMDKFDADWNKNVTPSAFLVARLSPDQQGALKANLERTTEGRATLKSLTSQLKWAHDNNLDQLVK